MCMYMYIRKRVASRVVFYTCRFLERIVEKRNDFNKENILAFSRQTIAEQRTWLEHANKVLKPSSTYPFLEQCIITDFFRMV